MLNDDLTKCRICNKQHFVESREKIWCKLPSGNWRLYRLCVKCIEKYGFRNNMEFNSETHLNLYKKLLSNKRK